MKLGATPASKAPSKNRVAIRPVKLRAAAMQASVVPQSNTVALVNLPRGSLTRSQAKAGCMAS